MPNCGGSDVKTTESRKKDMHRLQKQKTVTFVTSLKPDFLTDKNTFCKQFQALKCWFSSYFFP